MRRKILAVLISTILILSALILNVYALEYGEEWENHPSNSKQIYSDVAPAHWAFENIYRVYEKNWFNGYPDGTFRPSASITRAEALKVFDVFLGLEITPVTKTSYYDVDVDDWFAPYVEAGKELLPERMSIQGKLPFNPNMPITREDAMYALVKALGYSNKAEVADESVLNMFSDKKSISADLRPYVAVAVSEGLVSGRDNGTIGAQDPLTRAEFATLLYRASFFGFNSENNAKLQKVVLNAPAKKELKVGESYIFSATVYYSDGTTSEYLDIHPYNADDNGIVSINRNKVSALEKGVCEIKFNDDNLKDESVILIIEESEEEDVLEITFNEYNTTTSDEDVVISGTISSKKKETCILTCNKKSVTVKSNGDFTVTLPLSPGSNKFEFVAKNESGLEISKTVEIERKTSEEVIIPDGNDVIVSNGENYNIENAMEIPLNGTVKDGIYFSTDETNADKMESRWYKIVMPEAGEVSMLYLSENMMVNPKLLVVDENGSIVSPPANFLSSFAKICYPKTPVERKVLLQKGTFYLVLTRHNNAYGDYTLHFSTEFDGYIAPVGETIAHEFSLGETIKIPRNEPTTHVSANNKYYDGIVKYKFVLNLASGVRLTPLNNNVSYMVSDNSDEKNLKFSSSSYLEEHKAGTYYIYVKRSSDDSEIKTSTYLATGFDASVAEKIELNKFITLSPKWHKNYWFTFDLKYPIPTIKEIGLHVSISEFGYVYYSIFNENMEKIEKFTNDLPEGKYYLFIEHASGSLEHSTPMIKIGVFDPNAGMK